MRDTLLSMMWAFRVSQMIAVAARLGIADLLHTGRRTARELAALTHTNEDRLLRGFRLQAEGCGSR